MESRDTRRWLGEKREIAQESKIAIYRFEVNEEENNIKDGAVMSDESKNFINK